MDASVISRDKLHWLAAGGCGMNSSPGNASGFGVFHKIAFLFVAMFIVLGAFQIVASCGGSAQAQQKWRSEQAGKCEVIQEALLAGSAAGWRPHSDEDPKSWRRNLGTCSQWKLESCTERVPLLLVLDAAIPSLSEKFNKTGEDCSKEKLFAARFGLEAFAEHRRLLDEAVEDAGGDRTAETGIERDY